MSAFCDMLAGSQAHDPAIGLCASSAVPENTAKAEKQAQTGEDPPKESLLHKYKAKILYYQQFR